MSYYDEIAPGYNELYGKEQHKKLRLIRDNLKIKKSDKLLDVGCGTGFSLNYFNCECVGIEPSEKLGKYHKRIIPGVAEKLPFKKKTFDIVISVTAIHNFQDFEIGLKEMKRVGKRFAFSVLKRSKKFNEIKRLIHKLFKVKKEIEEDKDVIFII